MACVHNPSAERGRQTKPRARWPANLMKSVTPSQWETLSQRIGWLAPKKQHSRLSFGFLIQTYIHTCMHTYIHTHIYTYKCIQNKTIDKFKHSFSNVLVNELCDHQLMVSGDLNSESLGSTLQLFCQTMFPAFMPARASLDSSPKSSLYSIFWMLPSCS